MRSILALVLLACAACSASTADPTAESNAAVTAPDLVADLKAAYEAAPSGTSILTDVEDFDWMDLKGDARRAYNEYAGTGGIALIGGPISQVGTFEGHTIYFVAGDLSDTGSEWGFYDEEGGKLAVAYGGQGEHPGPGGVDWE